MELRCTRNDKHPFRPLRTLEQLTVAIWLVVRLSTPIHAQQTTSLSGIVADSSGAAIPGAEVVLENAATRYRGTQVTAADGRFDLSNIPFQDYQLQVSRDGFATLLETVSLRSPVPTERTFTLQPAAG